MFLPTIMTLLSLLPGSGEEPPAKAETCLRVIPLNAIFGKPAVEYVPIPGACIPCADRVFEYHNYENFCSTDIFPNKKMQLSFLQAAFPGSFAGKGRSLSISGNSLIAINQPAALNEISSFLQHAQIAITPRLRFRCWVYTSDQKDNHPPLQIITRSAAAGLVARISRNDGGHLLYSGTAAGRPWDCLYMGKHREFTYLQDHDVEIAQKAEVPNPVFGKLNLDQGLNLIPLLTPNQRSLAIFGMFTWREMPALPEKFDLNSKMLRVVELPRVRGTQVCFSTLLGPDEALVFSPGSNDGKNLRLILVAERSDPMPENPRGYGWLPTGLLTIPILRDWSFNSGNSTCEDDDDSQVNLLNMPLSDTFLEKTFRALDGSGDIGNPNLVKALPGSLLVKGTPEKIKAARQAVDLLTRDMHRRFLLEFIRESKPLNTPQATWKPLGKSLAIPSLGHRVGFAMVGREQAYLKDYEVEVAQDAWIADPVVNTLFDGTEIITALEPQGDRCQIHLHGRDSSLWELRTRTSGTKGAGMVQAPDLRQVSWRRNFTMRPGEIKQLGDGPNRMIAGQPHRTRLTLKLTEY